MNTIDISELPELPLEPAVEYLRIERLSLLEASKKSAEDEIRKRYGDEDKHVHGDQPQHDHDSERGVDHGRSPAGNQEEDKEHLPSTPVIDPNAPKDKGYFVLMTICLFGLIHLLPFIFLFQANEYWMHKFRNTTSNSTADKTFLQTNFFSLLKIVMTVPGVVCTFIAAIVGHKIRAQTRVFAVLFIHSSILIFQAVFTQISTDEWQQGFFIITVALEVLMAGSMSLGGSGSMGLIAKLPPRYMKSLLMGEGITSIFSAFLRLISIFSTPSTIDAALIYFTTGAALMVGTSIIFYFATQTKFFKYYTKDYKEERKQKIRNVGDFIAVLRILWPILLLAILPAIVPVSSISPLVQSEYKGVTDWGNKYFVTVCTYLVPALTGVLGRGIFNYMDYDCSLPLLYIIIISRETIFGALTFLSNAQPRNHLPVLLTHDWQYALMTAGSSLTSGFTSNLLSLKTMRMVPKDRIELSMMCNMFFTATFMAATSPLGMVAVNLL